MRTNSTFAYFNIDSQCIIDGILLDRTIYYAIIHHAVVNKAIFQNNSVQAYVDVRDVASAHVILFETHATTGRYICSEISLHHGEVVETLALYFPEYK